MVDDRDGLCRAISEALRGQPYTDEEWAEKQAVRAAFSAEYDERESKAAALRRVYGLTTRASRRLVVHGDIDPFDAAYIASVSDEELMKHGNCGKKTVSEIRAHVAREISGGLYGGAI